MSTGIQVILPEKLDPPFRVIYLLHGLHGDCATWIDYTSLVRFAKTKSFVFIMPEAGRSFYTDLKYGRKYYSYVSQELPEVCKKIFNISSQREDTAIMGCSMGGYGSLLIALTKPETFGFCGPIAPAFLSAKTLLAQLREDPNSYLQTGSEAIEIYNDIKSLYGDDLEYDEKYDILKLIEKFPSDKPKPKIFATCGINDDLLNDSVLLQKAIKNTNFNFSYEEWEGGHDWDFFYQALIKTIEFWNKI